MENKHKSAILVIALFPESTDLACFHAVQPCATQGIYFYLVYLQTLTWPISRQCRHVPFIPYSLYCLEGITMPSLACVLNFHFNNSSATNIAGSVTCHTLDLEWMWHRIDAVSAYSSSFVCFGSGWYSNKLVAELPSLYGSE